MTVSTEVVCRQCGSTFTPAYRAGRNSGRLHRNGKDSRRSLTDAQFCSDRCRQANRRWRNRSSAVTPPKQETAQEAVESGAWATAVTPPLQAIDNAGEKSAKKAGARPEIVPDSKWPGMYRIAFPDGTLSDMANRTRIKDALRILREGA